MSSVLQQRVEMAAQKFRADARRPVVFEFAGMPRAGKTSTIHHIQTFFKRCGFRVRVVVERASVCPIRDKKDPAFNVWTACTTLAQILEHTQDPPREGEPHLLILDRGLFDSVSWLDVLKTFSRTLDSCEEELDNVFRILEVNTSDLDEKATADAVAEIVIDEIERELREEILCVEGRVVRSAFSGQRRLSGSNANQLRTDIVANGVFRPRDEVEQDDSVIQALPAVVIRNSTGDVLRLRRKERREGDALHEQLVIWAGGHVRKEDAHNGDPIVFGALRELKEELRLHIERQELRYIGAVYADVGGSTSKHVALVFEWRADTDDVAVTLNDEFYERRGTSLSGKFVPVTDLVAAVESREILEDWSKEILLGLLASGPAGGRLSQLSIL